MSIGIYKITSPTGRIYIGQSVRIEIRFKYYKRGKCKTHTRLNASFSKYGVENHLFEIIELCQVDDLNIKERYYQEFYNVIGKNGLNCNLVKTYSKSSVLSEYTKSKIIKANTGKKRTKELGKLLSLYNKLGIIGIKGTKHSELTKQKIKDNHKYPMLGKKHSDEIKEIIKQASLDMWKKRGRRIVFDKLTGVYYENINEASMIYNVNINTLRGNLSGVYKSRKVPHLVYA